MNQPHNEKQSIFPVTMKRNVLVASTINSTFNLTSENMDPASHKPQLDSQDENLNIVYCTFSFFHI